MKEHMQPIVDDGMSGQEVRDALTWQPLRLLTFYRVILAGLLLILFFSIRDQTSLGLSHPGIYSFTCLGYLIFSVLAGFSARLRYPGYELQAIAQVLVDITAITVLMFASGGPSSGLGILLLISVATGSILLPGRMAFLFAAIAAMAMIGEHFYSNWLTGVVRGGGWGHLDRLCQLTQRDDNTPHYRSNDVGFRLVIAAG